MAIGVQRLPIAVPRSADETWDSYLTRIAHVHDTSLQTIADTIGVRVDSRWPAFFGVVIDEITANRVSDRLGLGVTSIAGMHLARHDGRVFDLTPLRERSDVAAARTVAARNWVYLAGSHYCPECLAIDGAWQLSWRLPWTTCCQVHRRLLVSRCPSCGAIQRTGRHLRTTRPTRTWLRHDGRRCTHPRESGPSATCLTDLTDTVAPVAGAERLAVDRALRDVIADGRGAVAGRIVPARECLTAWQAAVCFARAWRSTPNGGRWDAAKPWMSPPRDAAILADLLASASEVVLAPDTATAAAVLTEWCTAATGTAPTPASFADHAPRGTGLQPVIDAVLCDSGRAHSILTRSLDDLEDQERLRVTDVEVADIPQLVWPCALTEPLSQVARPGQDMIRVAVSLTLARIAGARDWGQAAESLGWTAAQGRQWARYAFRAAHHDLRRRVIDAALKLAPVLAAQPQRHRWARRPVTGGPTRLQLATSQRPACRREVPDTDWCPCQHPQSARSRTLP